MLKNLTKSCLFALFVSLLFAASAGAAAFAWDAVTDSRYPTIKYQPYYKIGSDGSATAYGDEITATQVTLDFSATGDGDYYLGVSTVSYTDLYGTQITVTVDIDNDLFTAAGHGLTDGLYVDFGCSGEGCAEPVSGYYYIVNAAENTFQISSTSGGSAYDLTSAGSGTVYVTGVRGVSSISWSDTCANSRAGKSFYVTYDGDETYTQVFYGDYCGPTIPGGLTISGGAVR